MTFFIIILIVVTSILLIQKRKPQNKDSGKAAIQNQARQDWESTWKSESPVKASGKCGNTVNWTLYEDGQLIIFGSGAMFDYMPETYDNGKSVTPWFRYRSQIRSAKVGKNITHLGSWVFSYCKNLKDVTLSCTVNTMPWGGFYNCENLEEINIPRNVTRICSDCFLDCTSLNNISIPSGVTEIGENAFYGCKNLKEIDLPETLTDIDGYAFAFCSTLKKIRIPKGVTYISETAFYKSGTSVKPRGTG